MPGGQFGGGQVGCAEYADWFNTRRLHTAIDGVPLAGYEAAYYAQTASSGGWT